jgi:hypothetical protein
LRTENSGVRIALLSIDELRPHERGSPLYLELLKQEILRDGMLKYPIIADEKTHVILDGMHRWLALKNLGYKSIPVMLVDAFQNPAIRVGRRRIHQYTNDPSEMISIDRVISAGLNRHLMQPRTTRHFFPFPKHQLINYSLHLLKKGTQCDVSEYLSEMSTTECSLAIKKWMDEISEELEFLAKKRAEVEREKQEFLNRVKNSANGFSSY